MPTMDDIWELLNLLREDIKQLKDSNDSIKTELTLIKNQQTFHTEKISELENNVSNLNTLTSKLKNDSRANNIIIYKVAETANLNISCIDTVKEIINTARLDVPDLCIVTAFRIGKQNSNKIRPILVRLLAPRWKQNFFNKIDNLKKMNINISNDLSPEERDENKRLLKIRFVLRENGITTTIKRSGLYRDGHRLTDGNINAICEEILNVTNPTTTSNSQQIVPISSVNDRVITFADASNTVKAKRGRPRKESATRDVFDTETSLDKLSSITLTKSKSKTISSVK